MVDMTAWVLMRFLRSWNKSLCHSRTEYGIIRKAGNRTTWKGQVRVQVYFICQDDKLSEAIDTITKAIALLCGSHEPNRINKRIQDLLHITDDMRPDSAEYQ